MNQSQTSLNRQIDIVFRELFSELSHLPSGLIFVQIRNNTVGKFGIRHDPIEGHDVLSKDFRPGLNEQQHYAFKQMAIAALQYKKGWTHGEILYEFALRAGQLITSVQFESNYKLSCKVISI